MCIYAKSWFLNKLYISNSLAAGQTAMERKERKIYKKEHREEVSEDVSKSSRQKHHGVPLVARAAGNSELVGARQGVYNLLDDHAI